LEAFSKTNYNLKIFGEGPLENQVKDYAQKNSNIQYCGFQNKETLTKEIINANALVVPSVCYEGMPMGIIEAFAMGTPVLCSNIGILQQMVVPLYTGLHFDPNSTSSVIDCLNNWATMNLSTKEAISVNCLTEFQEKYTADISITILQDVYQQIIIENEHNN